MEVYVARETRKQTSLERTAVVNCMDARWRRSLAVLWRCALRRWYRFCSCSYYTRPQPAARTWSRSFFRSHFATFLSLPFFMALTQWPCFNHSPFTDYQHQRVAKLTTHRDRRYGIKHWTFCSRATNYLSRLPFP